MYNKHSLYVYQYLIKILISLLFVGVYCIKNLSYAEQVDSTSKTTQATARVTDSKKLVYIVSDIRIPFWEIMGRGIKNTANTLGYELQLLSSENSAKRELESTVKAINDKVAGIIVSPTTSSACVTILKLAKQAGIPVVVSDIGADAGEYVSYISSNNKDGAYKIGKILAKKLIERGWQNGSVGIIAIPQTRLNGQARTAGFMQAMKEAGIKGAAIKQQSTFSEEETYRLSKEIINSHHDIRALWLQGSDRYQGAIRAMADEGKQEEMLLVTFDAEPVFLDLIPRGIIVGSAMQQPYLMGQEAVIAMHKYLNGEDVGKNIQMPILAISTENIAEKLSIIKRNVLGIDQSQ